MDTVSTKAPWLVVYHDEPDIEYEEDDLPSHKDNSIKFIERHDKFYIQSSDGNGWALVTEEQAERSLPKTPRHQLLASVINFRKPA